MFVETGDVVKAGCNPLLQRRGGCASKKMLRSYLSGADGVVRYLFDHPGRDSQRMPSAISFDVASTPPLEGINILDSSCTPARGDFEIGRILHLKSEIRSSKLDRLVRVQSDISGFRI